MFLRVIKKSTPCVTVLLGTLVWSNVGIAGMTYSSLASAYNSATLSRPLDATELAARAYPGICLSPRDNDPNQTDIEISSDEVEANGRTVYATTLVVVGPARDAETPSSVQDPRSKLRRTPGAYVCSNRFTHFLDVRAPYEKTRSPMNCFSVDQYFPSEDKVVPIGVKTRLPNVETNVTYPTSSYINRTTRFEIGGFTSVPGATAGSLYWEDIYRYSGAGVGFAGGVHAGFSIHQTLYLRELFEQQKNVHYVLAYLTDDFFHSPDGLSRTYSPSRIHSEFMCIFKTQDR